MVNHEVWRIVNECMVGVITFFSFNLLSKEREVFQAITSRTGGVSLPPFDSLNLSLSVGDSPERVIRNYQLVSSALAFELDSLVTCKQVHGDRVIDVKKKGEVENSFLYYQEEADAMITRVPGLVLMVRIADCVPIMFFDPRQKVVGIAHAGWRGTVKGIAAKTVGALTSQYNSDPADIVAGIGPCIGPCCYEVDDHVGFLYREGFSYGERLVEKRDGRNYLNLWEANRRQLLDMGIREENIELAGLCTSCHAQTFFSHRREQRGTGRCGAFIGIRG
jgi:hypothetical protein